MRAHYIKMLAPYFIACKEGEKPFTIRRDDRGYQKGDKVFLCRYGVSNNGHFGFLDSRGEWASKHPGTKEVDRLERWISYILTGGQLGIEPGYVVLGLSEEPVTL